ncbi:DUF1311 domain-containing protein [Rhizobium sp. XQZ8]|uniref:lysozyme inhibitor LprI family protein n=1 Tax=Rhizobium populisoli TaxID=2859785 RepID=UPI001C67042A|nr:lysozyme inhibitor LprI family protein [Rhizobium populisoli]MBW6425850.1 DUF1311 domain-containing protein [Rhizobium populisoli]
MRTLLLALLLIVPLSPASADSLYDKCMDMADGINPGFGKCGGEWVARADAKLNTAWKELMGHFKDREEAKQYLLTEQRLWNAYKESGSNFYNSGFGREGQVIHFPACRARIIENRINDLEIYRSDAE